MIASLAFCPAVAPPAHEGHGRAEWQGTVLHWLLEPAHFIPAALALAGIAIVVFRMRKRFAKRRSAVHDR